MSNSKYVVRIPNKLGHLGGVFPALVRVGKFPEVLQTEGTVYSEWNHPVAKYSVATTTHEHSPNPYLGNTELVAQQTDVGRMLSAQEILRAKMLQTPESQGSAFVQKCSCPRCGTETQTHVVFRLPPVVRDGTVLTEPAVCGDHGTYYVRAEVYVQPVQQ